MTAQGKPQFIHLRVPQEDNTAATHGGLTVGFVFDDAHERFVVGVARCSYRDRYVKSEGRTLAESRLSKPDLARLNFYDPEVDYRTFYVPYVSLIGEARELIQGVVRPAVSEACCEKILTVADLNGSYVNSRIATIAQDLVIAFEEALAAADDPMEDLQLLTAQG